MTAESRIAKRGARRASPVAPQLAPQPEVPSANAADRAPCLIGYARVSTDEQTTRQQVDALEAAGCAQVFIDEAISGSTISRPELDKCLTALQPSDTLVVWSLDRLGRSTLHLLTTVKELAERGVTFRSIKESIDASTTTGQLFLTILAGLAQFERARTTERINLALQAKKRRGERLGRKPALTPSQIDTANKLLEDGQKNVSEVARDLRVDRSTLYRALARKPMP